MFTGNVRSILQAILNTSKALSSTEQQMSVTSPQFWPALRGLFAASGICTRHLSIPSSGSDLNFAITRRLHTGTSSSAASSCQEACTSSGQPVATGPNSSSSSSLRSELGSGSAIGTLAGADQADSNTAQRRHSLLVNGKRFYDTVIVQPCQGTLQQQQQQQQQHCGSNSDRHSQGYHLLLRKYPVKTPAKNVLVLPSLSLALAVAAEWECLPTGKPTTHKMPLTGLACTAIDQPKEPRQVIEHLLKYVHTDGACIRCAHILNAVVLRLRWLQQCYVGVTARWAVPFTPAQQLPRHKQGMP